MGVRDERSEGRGVERGGGRGGERGKGRGGERGEGCGAERGVERRPGLGVVGELSGRGAVGEPGALGAVGMGVPGVLRPETPGGLDALGTGVPGGWDRPGMPRGGEPWDAGAAGERLREGDGGDGGLCGEEALSREESLSREVGVSGEDGLFREESLTGEEGLSRSEASSGSGEGGSFGETLPDGQGRRCGPEQGRRRGSGTVAGGAGASRGAQARPDDKGPGRAGDGDSGGSEPDRRRIAAPRRGAADPVKALLHRHRELCERAVDPLEIAAGLEARGVTDRTAARFRHRDVFSLAEELYARVPRGGEQRPEPEPLPVPRVRVGWVLLTLLPGTLAVATAAGLRLVHGEPRLPAVAVGVLAIALATRAALRHGPLAGSPGMRAWRTANATRAWTLWLLGYALFGDGLLAAVVTGGPDALPTSAPDGPWPTAVVPVLALTLACAPAAWCAHLLTAGARRRLAGSRGLEDFTAAATPLLFGTFTLFLGALTALLLVCATVLHAPPAYPQTLALGALLLLARLLTVHRRRHAPAVVLGAAAATEAVALALPLAGRLPGCAALATPVQIVVDAWGVGAVPALTCGAAALALLCHAARTLTQATAHAPTGVPE